MANLTAKELSALEDQLNMEKLLIKKYKMVSSMAVDQEVKTKCEQVAAKHQEHFNRLMSHLN
ncbi:MAG TPA: spore coat protein [Firmicutes bacterium]|nr:spore coat protein [Bacillota bacterium]